MEAVLALHRFITDEALWISGGVGFYFNRPEENEACADADWLRLNLALWHTTGEARYLDLAENVLVNQLYFAQVDSGAFCYLRGLQNRAGATFDVCCSHHAPRAMWEAMRYLYTVEGYGVWVNLLLDGSARLRLGEAEELSLDLETQVCYEPAAVVLTVALRAAPAEAVALHLRVPCWAGGASVAVNGQTARGSVDDGYICLDRHWGPGDMVKVRYPRLIRPRRGQRLGQHVLNPDAVAVFYGPHLYCAVDRWNAEVNLHLTRVAESPAHPHGDFAATGSNRLETDGISASGSRVRLILSPVYDLGGVANGIGRSHPVSTSPFRVWLPMASSKGS
jgi:hypothetical protein